MNITDNGNFAEGFYENSVIFHASGDFGGGTLKAQFLHEDGPGQADDTWVDLGSDFSWTSGPVNKEIRGSRNYRFVLSDATSPDLVFEAIKGTS